MQLNNPQRKVHSVDQTLRNMSCQDSLAQNNSSHNTILSFFLLFFLSTNHLVVNIVNYEDTNREKVRNCSFMKRWIVVYETRMLQCLAKVCRSGTMHDRRRLRAALNCRSRAEMSIRHHHHHHHHHRSPLLLLYNVHSTLFGEENV